MRALYERRPYPLPPANLDEYRSGKVFPIGAADRYFHLFWPRRAYRDDLDILVAGCGTSQAALIALRQPRSNVVGIDVSEASLEHTRGVAEQCGVSNLSLHRLAIEQVEQLSRDFDLVISTGVLHHLESPDAALHALRDVLRPDGVMFIMVYGRFGRTGVYMMQQYCRLLGVGLEDDELADLQAVLKRCGDDHPIAPLFRHAADFADPAALADMLLHPRDQAFTVSQIDAWLTRCDMKLCRWFHQAPYLPQCSALADSPHADRLARLSEIERCAAVELFRGSMSKHEFIACRDDRPGEQYQFDLQGDAWWSYTPARFPGAVIETADLPPGVPARLRHPQHPYRDIFIALTPDQVRLCEAVDGQRTIADIADPLGIAEPAAAAFFQRLWWFDQVLLTDLIHGAI